MKKKTQQHPKTVIIIIQASKATPQKIFQKKIMIKKIMFSHKIFFV